MQEFSLSDGGNRPNRLENGRRHFPVHSHKRDSVRAALRLPASKSKCGDVDAKLSKRRSDLADDSRLVAVSQVKNRPLKLRFPRNSFHLQPAPQAAPPIPDTVSRADIGPAKAPAGSRRCESLLPQGSPGSAVQPGCPALLAPRPWNPQRVA